MVDRAADCSRRYLRSILSVAVRAGLAIGVLCGCGMCYAVRAKVLSITGASEVGQNDLPTLPSPSSPSLCIPNRIYFA